jgi:hypothetical protein
MSSRSVAYLSVLAIATIGAACSSSKPTPPAELLPAPVTVAAEPPLLLPQETRLSNIRQLTNGGENAEAYFSFDGGRLTFQHTGEYKCDQIFTMKIDGTERKLISNGTGRTTCSFFTPDGKSIIYASTHLGARECPPVPDKE